MCEGTKRAYYLDVLRVVAMLAVVMLHVSADRWYGDVGSFSWKIFTGYSGIMRFCVPVFFMISGALFLRKEKHIPVKTIYGKYIFRLVIFLLFWGMVYQIYTQLQERDYPKQETPTVFVAEFYCEHNPDLMDALGTDEEALRQHFKEYGMAEGRIASPYFDINVYKANNPDLVEAFGEDNTRYYEHYINHGMAEGRVASDRNRNILVVSVENILKGDVHSHLWYIYAIIGLYILTPVLKAFVDYADRRMLLYALTILFAYSSVLPFVFELGGIGNYLQINIDKLGLQPIATYAQYFLLGHYLDTYELSWKRRYQIYGLGVLGTIFTVAATLWVCLSDNTINETFMGYNAPNVLFQSMLVFIVARRLFNREMKFTGVINILSRTSFGIYGIHVLFLLVLGDLGLTTLSFHPIISVPVISVLVLALSFGATFVLQKIPLLKKVVS